MRSLPMALRQDQIAIEEKLSKFGAACFAAGRESGSKEALAHLFPQAKSALFDAALFALQRLAEMTTDEFQAGGDRSIRDALKNALRDAGALICEDCCSRPEFSTCLLCGMPDKEALCVR